MVWEQLLSGEASISLQPMGRCCRCVQLVGRTLDQPSAAFSQTKTVRPSIQAAIQAAFPFSLDRQNKSRVITSKGAKDTTAATRPTTSVICQLKDTSLRAPSHSNIHSLANPRVFIATLSALSPQDMLRIFAKYCSAHKLNGKRTGGGRQASWLKRLRGRPIGGRGFWGPRAQTRLGPGFVSKSPHDLWPLRDRASERHPQDMPETRKDRMGAQTWPWAKRIGKMFNSSLGTISEKGRKLMSWWDLRIGWVLRN